MIQHSNRITEEGQFEIALNDSMEEIVYHSICVSNVACRLARELGLDESTCHEMAIAGMLHDIGKMQLECYMYGKDLSVYTVEQMKYMRMHSKLSYDILRDKGYSEFILKSILYHHENYDGSGYPENKHSDEIPLGARILRVSDVFSALISDRPYRAAFDVETAVELMIDEVKNFDMKIFLAFQRVIHEVNIEELTGENKSNTPVKKGR